MRREVSVTANKCSFRNARRIQPVDATH